MLQHEIGLPVSQDRQLCRNAARARQQARAGARRHGRWGAQACALRHAGMGAGALGWALGERVCGRRWACVGARAGAAGSWACERRVQQACGVGGARGRLGELQQARGGRQQAWGATAGAGRCSRRGALQQARGAAAGAGCCSWRGVRQQARGAQQARGHGMDARGRAAGAGRGAGGGRLGGQCAPGCAQLGQVWVLCTLT